jgi:superfamily II DNA/RNA helicase
MLHASMAAEMRQQPQQHTAAAAAEEAGLPFDVLVCQVSRAYKVMAELKRGAGRRDSEPVRQLLGGLRHVVIDEAEQQFKPPLRARTAHQHMLNERARRFPRPIVHVMRNLNAVFNAQPAGRHHSPVPGQQYYPSTIATRGVPRCTFVGATYNSRLLSEIHLVGFEKAQHLVHIRAPLAPHEAFAMAQNVHHQFCDVPSGRPAPGERYGAAASLSERLAVAMDAWDELARCPAVLFVPNDCAVRDVVEHLHKLTTPRGRGKASPLRIAVIHDRLHSSTDQYLELCRDVRRGAVDLVVCTPLVAYGLDLPQSIQAVLITAPIVDAHAYIHMAGRCGRLGAPGTVVTVNSGRMQFYYNKFVQTQLLAPSNMTAEELKLL